jgi:hypothetical protein
MTQDFEDRQRDCEVKVLDRLFSQGIAFIVFCGACVIVWYQWIIPFATLAVTVWRKL